MKHRLKIIFGLSILPIFLMLYFADKLVLWFMPWKASEVIQKWIYDPKKAAESLLRVIAALAIIGLYYLIANLW